jgi:translation initiation factor 4E
MSTKYKKNVRFSSRQPEIVNKIEEKVEESKVVESKVVESKVETIYPLNDSWTFWYGPWDNIQKVYEIKSINEFWNVFNSVIQIPNLGFKKDYHFFKTGIRPTYEDSINATGGCINIDIKNEIADKVWIYTLLGIIGMNFTDYNFITGAVGSSKAGGKSKISLWVTTNSDLTVLNRIAIEWKKMISKETYKLGFFPHSQVKTWEPKYQL